MEWFVGELVMLAVPGYFFLQLLAARDTAAVGASWRWRRSLS